MPNDRIKGLKKILEDAGLQDVDLVEKLNSGGQYPKWQYKITSIQKVDIRILESKLNEYGEDGWELVAIESGEEDYDLIFKRKIQQ